MERNPKPYLKRDRNGPGFRRARIWNVNNVVQYCAAVPPHPRGGNSLARSRDGWTGRSLHPGVAAASPPRIAAPTTPELSPNPARTISTRLAAAGRASRRARDSATLKSKLTASITPPPRMTLLGLSRLIADAKP